MASNPKWPCAHKDLQLKEKLNIGCRIKSNYELRGTVVTALLHKTPTAKKGRAKEKNQQKNKGRKGWGNERAAKEMSTKGRVKRNIKRAGKGEEEKRKGNKQGSHQYT